MRIVHYKSVAVKLVIHATSVKSGGFLRHADFRIFYYARSGWFVRTFGTANGDREAERPDKVVTASRHFVPTSTA